MITSDIRILLFFLIILLGSTLAKAEPNVSSAFEPDKEVRLDAGKTAGEILVYVPSDYNEDCNWPVIFYYHGMGGELSTQWLQIATGGKGFVIVSLEYTPTTGEKMRPGKYRAFLQKEVQNLAYVRHFLQDKLKIDPKKTVLAGISQGGWQVGDIFCTRPQLAAAAVITLAGYHSWMAENSSSMAGKYVYVGDGETDRNLKSAKRAAGHFTSRDAEVTMEIYKGFGHQLDLNAPKLIKWFSDLRNKFNQQPDANNINI